MIRFRKFLIALLMMYTICILPAGAAQEDHFTQIKQMIYTYYDCGSAGDPRVQTRLKQIRAQDPETGKRWQQIMDRWDETRTMELNTALPDGLDDTDALCIVVLGFQLESNGVIAPELEGRLQTALAAAEKYPNACILCTGGGTAWNNPKVTEAGQMAQWLQNHGVSKKRIILEDQSQDTAMNAVYSCRILREQYPQVRQLAIVSSDYHVAWGTILFEAELILEDGADRTVHVVSNAAFYPEEHEEYPFEIQGSGLLEIDCYHTEIQQKTLQPDRSEEAVSAEQQTDSEVLQW